VQSYAYEILSSKMKDQSLKTRFFCPKLSNEVTNDENKVLEQLKTFIDNDGSKQAYPKIERTVSSLSQNIEQVENLLKEIDDFKNKLESYDPTKEEMQESVTPPSFESDDEIQENETKIQELNSQQRQRPRSSTYMTHSYSEAFSTKFSEYESVQKSFELIQEKTKSMKEYIRKIQDTTDELTKLSKIEEVEEVDKNNIEEQINLQEERTKKLKEIATLIAELKKLEVKKNPKKKTALAAPFNNRIKTAYAHYVEKMNQVFLSKPVDLILTYLSAMVDKTEEYGKYKDRIEEIIISLKSLTNTLSEDSLVEANKKELDKLNKKFNKLPKVKVPKSVKNTRRASAKNTR